MTRGRRAIRVAVAATVAALRDARCWLVGAVFVLIVAWVGAGDTWWPSGRHFSTVVRLSIYWGLWLAWPLLALLTHALISAFRRGAWFNAVAIVIALVVTAGFGWARFIEPHQLRVETHEIAVGCGVRVALISDVHLGLYLRTDTLAAVIERLNALDVDAVLVAGDWTFEPSRDLKLSFAPLAQSRHKLIGVLGNHDERQPGPELKAPLRATLGELGVDLIDGRRIKLGACELVGLGDLFAGEAPHDLDKLEAESSPVPPSHRVVLAHNPDSTLMYDKRFAALTLAGHTHGGQVNVPVLTAKMLEFATELGFRSGLYDEPNGLVFVTVGIGMSKLPLRFRVTPTIDVIQL